MKIAPVLILSLLCTLTARADFSYVQTRKSATGMAASAMNASNPTTRHYFKGQKMKVDAGSTSHIVDFEAQTLTNINNDQKSYTVTKFSDLGQMMKDTGADVKVDIKETGERRNINGFNASQVMMTMSVESAQGAPGMKMQIEVELWISPDVPGAQEARAFFQKNGDKFPWASLAGGGGNAGMQKAMVELQRKIAGLNGVTVMQVMRMKMGGAGGDAQAAQMQQGMAQAMARLEEMKKQGGPQAAAAEQALARMGAARGGAGGGSLLEMTMESSGFSTAAVPDSVFAIPAGYQKK
ncbi:MAG TPA: DUF4412 domain-containing protein [Candidatus Acidoferrales bacterium]|nr:DUF4412 domain-containing protein [Candidatus Acidoferrales bacterium]